jgi:crotonobetainyl-CoA:carnitine CoA-transferase CaiB-like acyl-CoA transferase
LNILDGVRVIDLTMWAFVPSAGGVLAHWGADVIKIEGPRSPDPMRLLGGTLDPGDASWYFKHYSRGKRAITLDLKSERGRDVLYRLVETADVFLTSYLPKTRKALKFDIDDIRAVNPSIVYARGTGQGPRGPEAERGGYDGATWWCRGTLAESTMRVTGIDWPSGMVGHGDGMSGMTLAGGICAALLKRERTGETSVVDGSLLGTAVWFNGPVLISTGLGRDQTWDQVAAPRQSRPATQNTYRTKDGRFLILSMLGDHQDEWEDMVDHLGRPELKTDPRFLTAESRQANCAEAVAIFDEVFDSKTFEEWRAILITTKGVWSPIQHPEEIFDDPQTTANGFLRPVDYPTGTVRLPIPPVLFDEEGGDPPPAPDFGQHTDEILQEIGLDGDQVQELRTLGVIA